MNAALHRPMPRTGFTLLEVTLAMAMMSVLALSLYSALRISFKARDSALAAVGPARSVQMALDLVRQDVESALPPTGVLAGPFLGHYGTEVVGTSFLEFYAVTSGDTGQGQVQGQVQGNPTENPGICKIELLVRELPELQQAALVRRTTRDLLAPVAPEPLEEVLCRGVTAFGIRYFDGYDWLEEWDSTAQGDVLPMAIEVTLSLELPETPAQHATRVFFLACHREASLTGGAP